LKRWGKKSPVYKVEYRNDEDIIGIKTLEGYYGGYEGDAELLLALMIAMNKVKDTGEAVKVDGYPSLKVSPIKKLMED